MGRSLKGRLKCSESSLPKATGSRQSGRMFAKEKTKTKTKKLTNVVAIPKRHNPAGYDASPSVRKMENRPKNSRANPDTRSVTSITKRENWNHRMGQVRKDQSRVIWSNLPAQEKPLEHITQYCFQIVLEDLL